MLRGTPTLLDADQPVIMPTAIRAGTLYFVAIFALGVGLGFLRVAVLAPQLGELNALAIELPVMLGASFTICGALLKRYSIPRFALHRIVMGGTAFFLLMAAELGLSVLVLQRTVAEAFAANGTMAGLLGFGAQVAFGLIPLIRK